RIQPSRDGVRLGVEQPQVQREFICRREQQESVPPAMENGPEATSSVAGSLSISCFVKMPSRPRICSNSLWSLSTQLKYFSLPQPAEQPNRGLEYAYFLPSSLRIVEVSNKTSALIELGGQTEYSQGVQRVDDGQQVACANDAVRSLLTKQPPHVYGLAAVAYHNLLVNSSTSSCAGEGTNAQTLIVSGVSGSGKTESSKHLLRFLSHASSSLSCQQDCSQTEPIESVIEAVNPLLECFGNACTDENENSSRFGRHLELRFNRHGRLLGGQIRVLLLERGRALRPCADASQQQQLQHWRDRPFHSLLCCLYDTDFRADLNDENLDKRLTLIVDPGIHSGHRPLSPSHSWTKVAPLLNRFLSAATASREVARLLAGILLLARLPITTSSGARDSISDKLDENSPAEFLSESFADAEAAACSGLGLSEAGQLLACLAGARIESGRGSVFVRACTIRECAGRRDAVCRFLYGSLFAYLVGQINRCIQAGDANYTTASSTIGILDLYGFENFLGRNGLDQLLINFANERLQQFYLNHFVLAAKQEYTAERLPWEGDIDPVEDEFNSLDSANSLVELSVVTEAIGQAERCLTALEELCRLNRPDRQLADRLNCSSSNGDFSIRHFAGKVAYSIQQFPAHNRDRCPPELVSLLREQTQSLMLREILTDSNSNATVSSSVLAGVSVKFRQDLARLIDRLRSTRPLWIRCLRPSLVRFDMMMETGAGWSDEDVAKQLESCGLLPATRAARRLHPVRLTYAEFLTRYGCLMLARRDPHPRPLNSPSPAEFELAYRRQNDLPTTPSRTPERLLRRRTGASPADHQRRLAAGILTGRLAGKACPPVRFGRQFGRGKLFLTAGQAAELDRQLAQHRSASAVRLQRAPIALAGSLGIVQLDWPIMQCAALIAQSMHTSNGLPRANWAMNPPAKASPAPLVSTSSCGASWRTGNSVTEPSDLAATTGPLPWVMSTSRLRGAESPPLGLGFSGMAARATATERASEGLGRPASLAIAASSGSLKNWQMKGADKFIIRVLPAASECSAMRIRAGGHTLVGSSKCASVNWPALPSWVTRLRSSPEISTAQLEFNEKCGVGLGVRQALIRRPHSGSLHAVPQPLANVIVKPDAAEHAGSFRRTQQPLGHTDGILGSAAGNVLSVRPANKIVEYLSVLRAG
uniref:Myosin motor domain-containing protein n=1 Tax=Macrostomum lignano TaxID=282301 RepID=A0A1I8IAK3_9PLAT